MASFEIELVPSAASDERSTEQQTVNLAAELKAIRGVTVHRSHTQAPAAAKGLDVAAIGTLVGSLGPVAGAVGALVGVLRSWITRDDGRTLRVRLGDREIELTGANRDEERRLIDLFTSSVERG
jgi:hypothetical protein